MSGLEGGGGGEGSCGMYVLGFLGGGDECPRTEIHMILGQSARLLWIPWMFGFSAVLEALRCLDGFSAKVKKVCVVCEYALIELGFQVRMIMLESLLLASIVEIYV